MFIKWGLFIICIHSEYIWHRLLDTLAPTFTQYGSTVYIGIVLRFKFLTCNINFKAVYH